MLQAGYFMRDANVLRPPQLIGNPEVFGDPADVRPLRERGC
jgi:hypothetical protein